MMKISVVMPCYNAQRWVGEALESIANQSYQPHEIIVIDDGSTDDSVGVVKASGLDIRLLHTNRANGAGARNAGIEAATGDWIAFFDADDIWYPHHLEQAVGMLQNSDDVGYLCHWDSIYKEGGRAVHHPLPWPITEPVSGLTDQKFMDLYTQKVFFAMSGCLARRDVLNAIGGFDETQIRRHDIDMWLRVIHGRTWSYNPVVSTVYRENTPGSISSDIANREYYFLKCFLKNRDGYQSEPLDRLIHHVSRRVMAAAFTDGDRDDLQRAMELAWPNLLIQHKVLFSLVRLCPPAFRWVNRYRRRRLFRMTGSESDNQNIPPRE